MAMTAKFRRGEIRTAKYLAGADIAAHQVVVMGLTDALKCRCGVAMNAIANGATGIVAISGVWELPKVSGAVIKAGEAVNYDVSAFEIDDNQATSAAGDVKQFGCAVEDAGDGVTIIDVDISEPGIYDAA
jgi:predicted RecA/RadA family phage recombinase